MTFPATLRSRDNGRTGVAARGLMSGWTELCEGRDEGPSGRSLCDRCLCSAQDVIR